MYLYIFYINTSKDEDLFLFEHDLFCRGGEKKKNNNLEAVLNVPLIRITSNPNFASTFCPRGKKKMADSPDKDP